jgi:hypothetical protein
MFQLLEQLCPLFEKDEMRLVLLSHASIVSHGKIAMGLALIVFQTSSSTRFS